MHWWERVLGKQEHEEWIAAMKEPLDLLIQSLQRYLAHPDTEPNLGGTDYVELLSEQVEPLLAAQNLLVSLSFGPLDEVKLTKFATLLQPALELFSDIYPPFSKLQPVQEWYALTQNLSKILQKLSSTQDLKGHLVPKPA
ncbi:MAG: hypothetical protein AABX70_01800 [Nanoarchaeota archaeon]